MRIAIPYDNGLVFQHFGHTKCFKLYDVTDGKITNEEVVFTMGSGHGALAGFLEMFGVGALICGGIGGGARNALAQAGIDLYPGVTGSADQAAAALAANTLVFDPDTVCDHHDHDEEHDCGDHDCSSHNCGSCSGGCHG